MPLTLQTFNPVATRTGDINATTANLNALTAIIGEATNRQAVLSFDTSAIGTTDKIHEAFIYVEVKAKGAGFNTATKFVELWASDFGASVTTADHNLPQRNHDTSTSNPRRVRIGRYILHTAAVDSVHKIQIPSRFINRDGNSDFELRFVSDTILGATDSLTIAGAASVSGSYVIDPIENPSGEMIAGLTTTDERPRLVMLYYTPAEYDALPDPCIPSVDSESWVGFGIEQFCGYPVKIDRFFDATSTDIDTFAQNLASNTIRPERTAITKMAIGREGAGGGIAFQMTPEKWTGLLRGMFKITNSSSATVNSQQVWTHEFKIAQTREIRFFTLGAKKSQEYYAIFPGSILDSLNMSLSLDSFVECSASFLSRTAHHYNTYSVGINEAYIRSATAGYDPDVPLSFTGAQLTLNGRVAETIDSVSIGFSNNAGEIRTLVRNTRGVKQHFPGKLTASISFSMFFEDFDVLRKFLGDDGIDFPFSAKRSIQFDSFEVSLAGPDGEAMQEIKILFPRMSYTVTRLPLENTGGPIMLSAEAEATLDPAQGTSVVVTVKNSEPASAFAPSSDTLTVLPDGAKLLTS